MADLTSLIARGPDTATPLLQGIGLARQRQQDIQAQQQQEVMNQARQQQVAMQQQQIQAQQAQQKFSNDFTRIKTLNDLGLTDEAINLSEQTFGEQANIDFSAFKERRGEFSKVLGTLNKTLTDPKIPDQQRGQMFNQQVAELTQAFPRMAVQPGAKAVIEAGREAIPEVKPFEAEDFAERVSRELFGTKFDSLNQAQQTVVNTRLRQEGLEEKRQEGLLAEEARLKKGLGGETAGKLALLTQATKDVGEVKGFLFDEKGNLNQLAQAAGFFNLPVAQGRQISSRIQNAVAAKLRAETGAAANPDEVRNIAKRFEPVPGLDDGPATLDKLNRLEEFLSTGAFFIDPTGKLRQRSLEEFRGQDLQTGQSKEPTIEDKVDDFFK